MTEIHPELIAPCGLYCGVCRIHHATQENDLKYLKRLVRIYARRFPEFVGLSPEELQCDGCLSKRRFPFCQECAIRGCAQHKGFEGCYQCTDFPCALIEAFPVPAGRKVMLRSIPYWRTHGTAAWITAEEQRYHCPACDHQLFRGVRQCEQCRAPVSVD